MLIDSTMSNTLPKRPKPSQKHSPGRRFSSSPQTSIRKSKSFHSIFLNPSLIPSVSRLISLSDSIYFERLCNILLLLILEYPSTVSSNCKGTTTVNYYWLSPPTRWCCSCERRDRKMQALKRRFPLFASVAASSTFNIRTITTLRVSLPVTISPNNLLPRGTLFSPWSAIQFRGAKVLGIDVRPGNVIQRKGRIFQVVKAQHTQQGRGGATIQVELRDVDSGNKVTERFRTDEAFERVFVQDKSFTFLYADGDSIVLMEPTTFEQTEVSKGLFGKNAVYLKDDMKVTLQFFDGKAMSASVPQRVTCTVTEAKSHMKGLTATPQYKRVLVDNGLTVLVPPFIEAGDEIIVNTTDDSYMTRAKE